MLLTTIGLVFLVGVILYAAMWLTSDVAEEKPKEKCCKGGTCKTSTANVHPQAIVDGLYLYQQNLITQAALEQIYREQGLIQPEEAQVPGDGNKWDNPPAPVAEVDADTFQHHNDTIGDVPTYSPPAYEAPAPSYDPPTHHDSGSSHSSYDHGSSSYDHGSSSSYDSGSSSYDSGSSSCDSGGSCSCD